MCLPLQSLWRFCSTSSFHRCLLFIPSPTRTPSSQHSFPTRKTKVHAHTAATTPSKSPPNRRTNNNNKNRLDCKASPVRHGLFLLLRTSFRTPQVHPCVPPRWHGPVMPSHGHPHIPLGLFFSSGAALLPSSLWALFPARSNALSINNRGLLGDPAFRRCGLPRAAGATSGIKGGGPAGRTAEVLSARRARASRKPRMVRKNVGEETEERRETRRVGGGGTTVDANEDREKERQRKQAGGEMRIG